MSTRYPDRMAASVLNTEMPWTFSTSALCVSSFTRTLDCIPFPRRHPFTPAREMQWTTTRPDRSGGATVIPITRFSHTRSGFALRPAQLANGLVRCSYARDGNSMGSSDGGCEGGGLSSDYRGESGLPAMMRRSALTRNRWCDGGCGCAWGVTPEDRNGCRYNEIVLDGVTWTTRLPGIVEAIVLPINGVVNVDEGGDLTAARSLRQRFCQHFGLVHACVPVVTYDLHEAAARRTPFRRMA